MEGQSSVEITLPSPPNRRRSPYCRPRGRPPTHGVAMLSRVLRAVPSLDMVDRRSRAGVWIRRVRAELIEQVGGQPSAAQFIIIEEAAKTALIAKVAGDFILCQPTLVREDGTVLPVVLQRQALVDSLARLLDRLGLERVSKPNVSLDDYLASKTRTADNNDGASTAAATASADRQG